MVRLTAALGGTMRTFGFHVKGKKFNHRVPIQYQKFQRDLDPEDIVKHYSREDIDLINPRAGQRTYKDAQMTVGRKNFLLPNLSAQELELNQVFQDELDRQRAIISRVSKIRVVIESSPGKGTELMMNKDISTPYDCASHIHELLTSRTVVAEILPPTGKDEETKVQLVTSQTEVNENTQDGPSAEPSRTKSHSLYWDMHRPLSGDCMIKFRHFSEDNVNEVNKIYWRSCSFILGMAIRMAFKDGIKVMLHSWPKPDIRSGSFVYDVALNLSDKWQPCEQELRAFTKVMWEIKSLALPFERLQVDREKARQMFKYNQFKLAQIDSILSNEKAEDKLTVYRCGGLLDMSIGPMISNTNQIGRITLSSVHPFESKSDDFKGLFYRFQGVSLPQQLPMSSFLYQNILINNSKELNRASL